MIPPANSNVIFSETSLLSAQIDLMAENIYRNKERVEDSGLLGGKAGITLLFAYLSKWSPLKKYTNRTFEYLDELGDALENKALPHNMSGGVAGIAFVFQHLRNIGLLDKEEDLNLEELDTFINHAVDNDFQSDNWDPLHGMVGSGIYFLERNKETGEKKYLEKIVDHLSNMHTKVGDNLVWVTPGFGKYSNDNYNFGMAHGMPGVLSFLAQVYQRGIRQQEIKPMIYSCLAYLLGHEYTDDPLYCFPSSIDVVPKKEKARKGSRLGWCYGDLCMANVLIQCGKALQQNDLKNKGIDIALKTTRRNFEDANCVDAPFCHGTVGLVHQYHRLYQLTNNGAFKKAGEKWLDITLKNFYSPDQYAGGYYFRTLNEEKNIFEFMPQYGLLEGSAGIALVYLSYLYDIKPDWDVIFLTNV